MIAAALRPLAESALWRRIYRFVFKPRGRERGRVVLTQRRVFILPTGQGVLFAGMLVLMLIGSTNYSLSLGFVLTFLLGAVALTCILHTFRNLAGLVVQAGKASPVFAGESAGFTLNFENPGRVPRVSLEVSHPGSAPTVCDVAAGHPANVTLFVTAPRRGWLHAGRFTLHTRYPLGLFRAWSYLELDMHCLVYPRPDTSHAPPPQSRDAAGDGRERGSGAEDFAGFRDYRPGDSPRHIAWKAAAQERGTLTKQFSGRASDEVWLEWDALDRMDTEARLSRLARWVIDAEASGVSYGLRIPGRTLEPGHGPDHRHACLEALAVFGP